MTEPEVVHSDGASGRIYRHAPSWEGERTAAIGACAFADAGAGAAFLNHVAATLQAEGFDRLIGPMDGDTWHNYRVVTETDGSPPFMLEPRSTQADLAAFSAAGFEAISEYVSARSSIEEVLAVTSPKPHDPLISVAAWDGREPNRLINELFQLSGQRFQGNRFFKPIDARQFLALYEPIFPAIDPRLVMLARSEGAIVGYLFGYPDRLQGPSPKTVVFKTYASSRFGAGRALADHFHHAALEMGFVEVIHALMHLDNVSRRRSARHGAKVFRRYALMGKRLRPAQAP